jgi:hypothetical protein
MAAPFYSMRSPSLPTEPPTEPVVGPPAHWPAFPAPPPPEPRGRAWAAVTMAWIGAIVATIAAFAPWAHYADGVDTTGIEHGDGWFVLVVAFTAAGFVGALAFGWRHLAARVGVLACSAALFFLYAINRIDLARSHDYVTRGAIKVGGGLFAVAVAACLLLLGGLVIPPNPHHDAPSPA